LRLYGFIEKQAPQKALCLGPDPPPGKTINFIDFYAFLRFWGPSIEPEKRSLKSASTANPPQNDHFIGFFNLSRPNLAVEPFLLKYLLTHWVLIIHYPAIGIVYSVLFGVLYCTVLYSFSVVSLILLMSCNNYCLMLLLFVVEESS
jgi:hypothetical protein